MNLVKSSVLGLSLATLSTTLVTSAHADFVNGSFEDPYIGSNNIVNVSGADVTGWNYDNPNDAGALVSNDFDGGDTTVNWYNSHAGNQYMYLASYTYGGETLSQSVELQQGSNTVSFLQADFQQQYTTPGGAIDLTILNSDGSYLTAAPTFTTAAFSDFIQQSFTFTAPTAGLYKFDFISVTDHAGIMDDVHVQPAPEPSTFVLMGAIGVGFFVRRRLS